MEAVGMTKGCAMVLVAKTRTMKLKVHSATLRDPDTAVA